MNTSQERPEGWPTVVSGDYSIPKHSNWVEVDGKYLVDFNDLLTQALHRQDVQSRIDELSSLYDELISSDEIGGCEVLHDHTISERIKELTDSENKT